MSNLHDTQRDRETIIIQYFFSHYLYQNKNWKFAANFPQLPTIFYYIFKFLKDNLRWITRHRANNIKFFCD